MNVPLRYRLAWALGFSPVYVHPEFSFPTAHRGPGTEGSTAMPDQDTTEVEGVDEEQAETAEATADADEE